MKINFSANLETIRKSKKISQEELAELIGVSRQTIYKWEADICLPNLNKIENGSYIFYEPLFCGFSKQKLTTTWSGGVKNLHIKEILL